MPKGRQKYAFVLFSFLILTQSNPSFAVEAPLTEYACGENEAPAPLPVPEGVRPADSVEVICLATVSLHGKKHFIHIQTKQGKSYVLHVIHRHNADFVPKELASWQYYEKWRVVSGSGRESTHPFAPTVLTTDFFVATNGSTIDGKTEFEPVGIKSRIFGMEVFANLRSTLKK